MKKDISSSMSLISRIHTDTAEFLTRRLSEQGLPNFASSHGFILFQLSLCSSLTMGELAERVNRDKSTLTVLVRKLELEGFVSTSPSPDDKRSRIIMLTEKGRTYNTVTSELSAELLTTFYTGFSENEKEQLCCYLERIQQNFETNSIT
jgi:MarR family transcriptional regulator, organic hydroperoxide resistance regulator